MALHLFLWLPRGRSGCASSGSTVRSCPIMPPTRAFTPTSSENWARLARSPRRTGSLAKLTSREYSKER